MRLTTRSCNSRVNRWPAALVRDPASPRCEATMAQHFLLSAVARTISLGQVLQMTDAEAEVAFASIRWPETAGVPGGPGCCCTICYDCRRAEGGARWRCKACRKDFSLTS